MKKQSLAIIVAIVGFSLPVSIISQDLSAQRIKQSAIEQLEKVKSRLDKEVDELKKCIKRDQNCDPTRKKIYITMVVIGALAVAIGTGAGIWHLIQKYQISLLKLLP